MATLFREVNSVPRQDWHLTSTGVSHQYRPPLGYSFQDSKFQPTVHEPLPLSLLKPDQVTRDKKHTTTTGTIHDKKFVNRQLTHPVFEKGPNLTRANYIKDLSEKLGPGGWRRPLTMGNQKTETQDEFDAKDGIRENYYFDDVFKKRPFLLNDHLAEGPTKYGSASTMNPKLGGRIIDPTHMGVLDYNEPYLTTYRNVHRLFTPQEKDLAKAASADDIPKSSSDWTYQPMRDTTKFKFRTIIPRMPKAFLHAPHRGLLTEYQDYYQRPADVKRFHDVYCPEDTPWTLPKPSAESIMSVPKFYTTEYQTIGKSEMVPV